MNGNNAIQNNNTQAKKNNPLKSSEEKNRKNNDDEHKAIICSLCYSLSSINIIKENENEEIFIELTCRNNHTQKMPIKNFLDSYQNYFIKKCQICNMNININKLLYCFFCKEIFCVNCREKHLSKLNKKNNHLYKIFILKEKNCLKHKFKINEYYCITCEKYLCKDCLPIAHFNHNIKNLYSVLDHKNKLKNIIEEEENINKKNLQEFNKIIVNAKNKFRDVYNCEKIINNIKKNIINTYENNNGNFYNINNLNLIEKNFYNKKGVKYDINNLSDYFCINKNNLNKNNQIINNNYEKKEDIKFNIKRSQRHIVNIDKKLNQIENNEDDKSRSSSLISSKSFLNTQNLENNDNNDNFKLNNLNFNQININNCDNIQKNEINNDSDNNDSDKNEDQEENQFENTSITSIEENNTFYKMETPLFYNNYNKIINNDSLNINKNIGGNNDLQKIDNNNSNKNINEENVQKKYYKIIQTNKNIKHILCLSHNNLIIISYDVNNCNNLSIYKIHHNENNYIKLDHLKYIHIFNEPINDIDKYQDETLLICSNKVIVKIKIINYITGDYSILFRFTTSNSNINDKNSSLYNTIFKMCLPLSNTNFLICNQMNNIIYWKREKTLNSVIRKEKETANILQTLYTQNYNIFTMKEIQDNLIVASMQIETNGKKHYSLLYLQIDNNNIKVLDIKPIHFELNTDKNSIQKINDNYFLVLLNFVGFVIIETNKKDITKKIIDKKASFLFVESKLYKEYLYTFVIKKNIIDNNLIFKQYKCKIEDFSKDLVKFKSGKDFLLNFKNQINKIGIFFEENEINIINNINKYVPNNSTVIGNFTVEVVLVVGEDKIIIFNYYP